MSAAKPGAGRLEPRPASKARASTETVMEPRHQNSAGNVHGAEIFHLVDVTAAVAAAKHSGTPSVTTAAIDGMSFERPVHLGDVIKVTAMVNHAFRTSMEVGVVVVAEDVVTGAQRRVANAHLVFVALDEHGQPMPIPPLLAETDADRVRQAEALVRQASRLRLRKAGSAGETPNSG